MATSNWQGKLPSLLERIKYTFDHSLFYDIEFSVGSDGKQVTIQANRYLLAVSSSVFEAMFYGPVAETSSPIQIQDCTKEGLQEILRYAHYEEAKLTGSNVMEVLYLAKKYMMPFLEEKCKQYIKNEVGPDDVLIILPQVQKLNDKDLEEHCWKIVDQNADEVISSKSFLNLPREFLCQVLMRDSLEVDKELHLFRAVDKWATNKVKEKGLPGDGDAKRDILGEEVVRLIRFSLMTQKEFAEAVLPRKMLTSDEVTEVIHAFNNIAPESTLFVHKERAFLSRQILVSDIRFSNVKKRSGTWKDFKKRINIEKDVLDFSVSEPAALVGMRLFGTEGDTHKVKLKILANNRADCVSKVSSLYSSEKVDLSYPGPYYGFTVKLTRRVILTPDVVYTVQAKISGPVSYEGKYPKKTAYAGDIEIRFNAIERDLEKTLGQFPSFILRPLS